MYIYSPILTSDFLKYPRYILYISPSPINFSGRCSRCGRHLVEHWFSTIYYKFDSLGFPRNPLEFASDLHSYSQFECRYIFLRNLPLHFGTFIEISESMLKILSIPNPSPSSKKTRQTEMAPSKRNISQDATPVILKAKAWGPLTVILITLTFSLKTLKKVSLSRLLT